MDKIERKVYMLLENNTKNIIDLIKMYERLNEEKKLLLLIHLFEKIEFKTDYEIRKIIDILKYVLKNLNQNYDKTIINFSKYKDLLFISSKYLELKEDEKKKCIIELLFDIYETDFENNYLNKYINDNLFFYDFYYSLIENNI